MHPYTVHTHNILYTSYTLMWFLGIWDIGGNTHTTNKIKTKPTPPQKKLFPKIFHRENFSHKNKNQVRVNTK